jgi:zinc protease
VVKRPVTKPAVLTGEQRLVVEDSRARAARYQVTWPGVSFNDADKVALNALGSILVGGRTSGLMKALVYDHPLATRVTAGHYDLEETGLLQLDITPRPDASLTQIEQLVDSIVADMHARVSPAAVSRFQRAFVDTAQIGLQRRVIRADTLALSQLYAGDPGAYAKALGRAEALTPADVQRAARKYLTANRVVVSYIPAGKLDQIAKPNLPYKNVTPRKAAP